MKSTFKWFSVLLLSIYLGQAQVYNQGPVGYMNVVFQIGDNLFTCPWRIGTTNLLSDLFPAAPAGTTISFWDPATASFYTNSVFTFGAWSANLILQPGMGAKLTSSVAFTNTFAGSLVNHDGSSFNGVFAIPPVFTGPSGIYLFGDAAPFFNTGTNVFLNILGRLPEPGESVTMLDALTQTYTTSTYLGNDNWNNFPVLGYGQAGFFNITSVVPEPSTITLTVLGLMLLGNRVRSRR